MTDNEYESMIGDNRVNNIYYKVCSMDNLKLAHKHAKRGKGWYAEVQEVEAHLDEYLLKLQRMLIDKTFKTSSYKLFKKEENEKVRDIYKLPYFPDRIAQWALMQILEPYIMATLVAETYSAIPKRGAEPIIRQLGSVGTTSILVSDPVNTEYCLKMDVRKYYPSIDHEVLKKRYRLLFSDEDLLWLIDEIIDSISTFPVNEENKNILQRLSLSQDEITFDGKQYYNGIGIPIGNYMSQYSGNYYLSPLDHYLKEDPRAKYQYRYMDDIVVLGSSSNALHSLKLDIDDFLENENHQVLKPNWQIFPSRIRGIDFVGYRFFGRYTILRKSTLNHMKKEMLYLEGKRNAGFDASYHDLCSFYSYYGLLKKCNMSKFYLRYVKENKIYVDKILKGGESNDEVIPA